MKLFQIQNKSGKVSLNDLVTKWSADELISEMEKIFGTKAVEEGLEICGVMACAENAVDTLEIEINSPGGSVLDGHRIYQELRAMRDRGVRVIATINSLAASMGSVIAMAADEIRMVKGGRLMIHEASQTVSGTARDHLRAANLLESMTAEIADIYADRSGQPLETVREMMADETWLGAEEAREAGFVDAILDGERVDTAGETKAAAPQTTEDMFKSTKELQGQVEALGQQIEALNADVEEAGKLTAEAEAKAQEATEQLAESKAKVEKLETLAAAQNSEIESLKAEAEKAAEEKAQLEAKAEETAEKVAEAAAAELATIGVEPAAEVAVDEANAPLNREEFNKIFNSIEDTRERFRWYSDNKHRLAE